MCVCGMLQSCLIASVQGSELGFNLPHASIQVIIPSASLVKYGSTSPSSLRTYTAHMDEFTAFGGLLVPQKQQLWSPLSYTQASWFGSPERNSQERTARIPHSQLNLLVHNHENNKPKTHTRKQLQQYEELEHQRYLTLNVAQIT